MLDPIRRGVLALVAGGLFAACGVAPVTEVTEPDGGGDGGGGDAGVGVTVRVDRVIDGDSLEVLAGGEEIEVRLVGINAPERYTLADTETCVGQRAGDVLRAVLEAGAAAGDLHLVGDETDRFGRRLAEIDLGSVDLAAASDHIESGSGIDGAQAWTTNTAMVASGWALALWSAEDPELTAAMVGAAAAGRGWWGTACGATVPDLVISDEQVNPPGDDGEQLAEEWVEVANEGGEPVDLDGWTIRDETTSNRFLIDGVTLVPGATVRFRTGQGSSSAGDVYLGETYPVWSNRGETVLLLDPEGRIAAHLFVESAR